MIIITVLLMSISTFIGYMEYIITGNPIEHKIWKLLLPGYYLGYFMAKLLTRRISFKGLSLKDNNHDKTR